MVVKSRKQKRKFKRVKKTKGGVATKYVTGSNNPRATEKEIKNTRRLYKAGKLTPKMMDRISKRRVKSGK
jgi:hypothetical protein